MFLTKCVVIAYLYSLSYLPNYKLFEVRTQYSYPQDLELFTIHKESSQMLLAVDNAWLLFSDNALPHFKEYLHIPFSPSTNFVILIRVF